MRSVNQIRTISSTYFDKLRIKLVLEYGFSVNGFSREFYWCFLTDFERECIKHYE